MFESPEGRDAPVLGGFYGPPRCPRGRGRGRPPAPATAHRPAPSRPARAVASPLVPAVRRGGPHAAPASLGGGDGSRTAADRAGIHPGAPARRSPLGPVVSRAGPRAEAPVLRPPPRGTPR